MIYALVSLLLDTGAGVEVPLVGNMGNRLPGATRSEDLAILSALIAAFFLFKGALHLTLIYAQQRLSNNAGVALSTKLFQGYLRLPYSFHLQRKSAESIRNADQSVTQIVETGLTPIAMVVSEGFIVVGVVFVLLVIAPIASLLALISLGVITLLLLRLIHPRLTRLGVTRQEELKESLQFLQQSIHGIRDIKVYGAARFFTWRFSLSRARLAGASYRARLLMETPRITMETTLALMVLLLLGFDVFGEGTGRESLATVGLFAYAVLRVLPSVNRIISGINSLRYTGPAVRQVHEDLRRIGADRADEGDVEPFPFEQDIRLQDVYYRYPGSDVDALKAVDITIPKGSSLGVIGTTGGGKSTLVDVVMGVLAPHRGSVMVDGVDLAEIRRQWQLNIGLVPQTLFLLDDTIARNVAFAIEDEEIDEGWIGRCLEIAELDRFVKRLPQGMETVVGERGVRLSGGQRQRVAIARAMYRRPKLLVFDEGTSALDNRTEASVMRSVTEALQDTTLMLVAHRLTTLRGCNRVVAVEDGRIADSGTYEEMVESHGPYVVERSRQT